jgi:hypothetical protein
MTNEEAYALGRRLVACKGFRPMRGMRDMQGGTWKQSELFRWWHDHHTPDLTDPATLGCLLHLVREAWGDECVCALPVDYGPGGVAWFCRLTAGGRDLARSYLRGGVGEAEALVAALEAAP